MAANPASLLWVDKYRPTSLDSLDHHPDLTQGLKNLAKSQDFPHLLFYGPSGAGKKTRVLATLREIYGAGVEKMKIEQMSVKMPNRSDTIDVTVVTSAHHIEVNPSESGFYDRLVVQDVIKEIAMNQPLEVTRESRSFKVVIMNDADFLSKDAQQGLRRTMEKYMAYCRIILVAQSISKVIEAVRSRCLCLRVGAPTHAEIVQTLTNISTKEGFSLPPQLANTIAVKSQRNLRRAILMLMTAKTTAGQVALQTNTPIPVPDWETFMQGVATQILQNQTPQQLHTVRSKLYELITHAIPADVIMKTIARMLIDKVDDDLKHDVAYYAAVYDQRMNLGQKPIMHIEAFIAKFMALYKSFLVRSFGE